MSQRRQVTMTAMLLVAACCCCSPGKSPPAVHTDAQPRSQIPPKVPPPPRPEDPAPPQAGAMTKPLVARFSHRSRRAMIGEFTNSYSNTSRLDLQFGPGAQVTLTDAGESTDRVVHQKPFVCNTEAETRTWTVTRAGTWTTDESTRTVPGATRTVPGTTRILTLKITRNDCRHVKTCDDRPPEHLSCDALPDPLVLTCTEGEVAVDGAKHRTLTCTGPERGSYTGFPWAFGLDACLERVLSMPRPFRYELCAPQDP